MQYQSKNINSFNIYDNYHFKIIQYLYQQQQPQAQKLLTIIQSFYYQNSQIADKQCNPTNQFIIYNRIYCNYSNLQFQNKKPSYFVCSSPKCKQYPAICQNIDCKCNQNHPKCKILLLSKIISDIQNKINRKSPLSFNLYIKAKLSLINHLINKISQQKQVVQQWLQKLKNKQNKLSNKKKCQQSNLYIFGITKNGGRSSCNLFKLSTNQESLKQHSKCKCSPLNVNSFLIQNNQALNQIQKKILKKYNQILEVFENQIQQIQQCQSKSFYLNFAEYKILKYLMKQIGMINIKTGLRDEEFCGQKFHKAIKIKYQNLLKNIYPNYKNYLSKIKQQNEYMLIAKMGFDQNILLKYQKVQESFGFEKTIEYLRNQWKFKFQRQFHSLIEGNTLHIKQIFTNQYMKINPNQNSSSFFVNTIDNIQLTVMPLVKNMINEMNNIERIFDKDMFTISFPLNQFQQKIIHQYTVINIANKKGKVICYIDPLKKCDFNPFGKIIKACQKNKKIKQINYMKYSNKRNYVFGLENQQFLNTNYVVNHIQLQDQSYLSISATNKDLQNFHFNPKFQQQNTKILQKFQKLRIISFDDQQFKEDQKQYFYSHYKSNIKQLLLKLKKLKFISILHSLYQHQNFNNFLKSFLENNCGTLQAIACQSCSNNYFKTLTIILNFIKQFKPNIEFFSLRWAHRDYDSQIETPQINLINIEGLKSLKILDISYCDYLNKNSLSRILFTLTQLTHFAAAQVKHIDNDMLQIISKSCLKLEMLNIYNSFVNQLGIRKLKSLKNLKSLYCGQNRIQSNDLIQLSKHCRQINKLSINSVTGKIIEVQLLQMDRILINGINYLDIRSLDTINYQFLEQLKSINTLLLNKTQNKKRLNIIEKLKKKGVQVIFKQ